MSARTKARTRTYMARHDECAICMAPLVSGPAYQRSGDAGARTVRGQPLEWRLPCGHMYHTACIMACGTSFGGACPVCMTQYVADRPPPLVINAAVARHARCYETLLAICILFMLGATFNLGQLSVRKPYASPKPVPTMLTNATLRIDVTAPCDVLVAAQQSQHPGPHPGPRPTDSRLREDKLKHELEQGPDPAQVWVDAAYAARAEARPRELAPACTCTTRDARGTHVQVHVQAVAAANTCAIHVHLRTQKENEP